MVAILTAPSGTVQDPTAPRRLAAAAPRTHRLRLAPDLTGNGEAPAMKSGNCGQDAQLRLRILTVIRNEVQKVREKPPR